MSNAPNLPDLDNLITYTLRFPLLNSYYGHREQKQDLAVVAEEVKRRYLEKLSAHNDTGRLASTARIVYFRAKHLQDLRWDADFYVGGPGADYADDLEAEYHLIDEVLRDMGVHTPDFVSGPTGRIPVHQREPRPKKKES